MAKYASSDRPNVMIKIEIRKKLRPTFSLDLIARTSKQIRQRLDMGDFFIQDILQRGRILHEANHARVG